MQVVPHKTGVVPPHAVAGVVKVSMGLGLLAAPPAVNAVVCVVYVVSGSRPVTGHAAGVVHVTVWHAEAGPCSGQMVSL